MPVLGLNIKSIIAKKGDDVSGSVKVNSNTSVKDVREQDLPAIKQKGLGIGFEYRTDYVNDKGKSLAEIVMSGEVLFVDAKIEDVIKAWKKDSRLPDDVSLDVVNAVLRKGVVKAIALSEELQLPPPVVLPLAKKGDDKE
jgi:hypothetical protein